MSTSVLICSFFPHYDWSVGCKQCFFVDSSIILARPTADVQWICRRVKAAVESGLTSKLWSELCQGHHAPPPPTSFLNDSTHLVSLHKCEWLHEFISWRVDVVVSKWTWKSSWNVEWKKQKWWNNGIKNENLPIYIIFTQCMKTSLQRRQNTITLIHVYFGFL